MIAGVLPLTKLVRIVAGWNECRDKPMQAFADAFQDDKLCIEELDFQSNEITDAGGVSLATAVCKSGKLKKLNLANNELKNETARVLSFGLRENTCLRYLNLDGNSMKLEYLELVQSFTKSNLTRTSKG
jgi:Ran GTPase-activating protein (RanGAP) involved in mRNA processing and transport